MKAIRSKKFWSTRKKKRAYTKRQPLPKPAEKQIDEEIDRLQKEITVLKAAKALLNR